MDLVVAIAIGVLSAVFLGALLALVFVCRQRCRRPDFITEQHKETRFVTILFQTSLNLLPNLSAIP